ncbi:MAG TPA: hypothetical protein VGF26_28325, partial [Ramlibacter sp.]
MAFRKAVLAGMAGAAAWELAARALILSGVPFVDLVHLLGTVVLPNAGAAGWWTVGLLLHLAVGALWAVFYAYMFWSVLPRPPVVQGLVFSILPMLLAIFAMRPQLELMNPLVVQGLLPFSGRFGTEGGWAGPLSVAIGHLLWGGMLGALYPRPVGHRVGSRRRPPRHAMAAHAMAPRPAVTRGELRFLFATGIESSYPTLNGGRWRLDLLEAAGHYRRWREDLQLVHELGLRGLRYGPPLHRVF